MNRALPNVIIDAIREGAHPKDLRERGERAVWSLAVRTACSAFQRGWTQPEWAALVSEPQSHLGTQMKLKRGRTARTESDYAAQLVRAWTKAEQWLAEQPASNAFDIDGRIAAVRERVADPDAGLGLYERAILDYACTVAERNGTDRPALPRREVAEGTGLTERTVRTAMERMHRDGLLRLEVRGKSGATNRKANLYRLPEPERIPISVPVNGSVGHLRKVYGTPGLADVGTPEQVYGTPTPELVKATFEGTPAALADLLHLAAGRQDLQVTGDLAEVVPLRGRHAS